MPSPNKIAVENIRSKCEFLRMNLICDSNLHGRQMSSASILAIHEPRAFEIKKFSESAKPPVSKLNTLRRLSFISLMTSPESSLHLWRQTRSSLDTGIALSVLLTDASRVRSELWALRITDRSIWLSHYTGIIFGMGKKLSKTVLVTGSSGYIGRHFCRMLEEEGISWVGVDKVHLSSGILRNTSQVDILDTNSVAEVIRNHDVGFVVHLAGLALAGESVKFPQSYFEANIDGTASILRAMERHRVQGIVFASSCSVYGSGTVKFKESDSPQPQSPYAVSKVEAEFLINGAARDFSSIILRFFNVVGGETDGSDADNHQPEPHILPNLVRAALTQTSFTIFGNDFGTPDGTSVREYIDVKDVSRAILLSLRLIDRSHCPIQRTYNLGSGVALSALELAKLVSKTIAPFPIAFSERRPGDPAIAQSDSSTVREALGWSPIHTLEASIGAQRKFMEAVASLTCEWGEQNS